jgi:uncharacterized protein involved in exopolysaccharide biosynthesis
MSAIFTPAIPSYAEPGAGNGKSLADHLAMLKRQRLPMTLAFVLLMVIAVVVATTLPPVYRSTATILIKEQEIPQELVRSTVTSYADERIQVISQQVMTRATLLDMVDKYTLYGNARQRETSEEIIDRMRRDIKLTPISADVTDRRTGSQMRSTIAFSLSYDSEVAANAQKIANELTTLFLNENVKNRQQKAAETTSFLDEELARMGEHISELEKRLADFKKRNQGRLPELALVNQASSERMASDIQRLERDLQFAEERRGALLAQLADTRPNVPVSTGAGPALDPADRLSAQQTQLNVLLGSYNDEHPDVKRLRREIAKLQAEAGTQDDAAERESRLVALRDELAQARRRYSANHPDVARLERSVAAAETAAASAAAKASAPAAAGSATSPARPRKADNPVYLALKSQIETLGAQIQSMQTERQTLRGQLTRIDARVVQAPEVEREYLEMGRDLDSSRLRFRELREKQMQAQVAEQLERGRKAERFTLLEPPIYPEKPYRPNRSIIVLMGAVLALAGALGVALLREALDGTVHTPREAVRLLQVPVLALIPAEPVARRPGARRRRWLIACAVALVLCGVLLTFAHIFYLPLDVLWYSVLRRLSP